MFSIPLLIWFNVLWFFSGLLSGITSFGGNLIAVPIMALSIEPREAILLGCISCSAIFASLAFIYRRHILWKDGMSLTIGAIGGIPIGVWFLTKAGPRYLLLIASIIIILFLLWQLFAKYLQMNAKIKNRILALPMGFFSGIMMGATGMGGPPLILYAFMRGLNKEETLATINLTSIAIMLVELPWQYSKGLLTPSLIIPAFLTSFFAFAGIAASIPIIKRLDILLFRRLLLGMLTLSAMILLIRAL